jgi:hypothetical protein
MIPSFELLQFACFNAFSPHVSAWAELLEEKEAGSGQSGVAGMSTVDVCR